MRTSNRLHYSLPLALGLVAAACGSSGPTTLTVNGSAFSAVEGKPVKLAIVDVGGKKIVHNDQATVSGGKFSFTMDVPADTTLRIDAYVDDDGNGHCEWGVDHVYAVDEQGLGEGKTDTKAIAFDLTDSRGCLSFGASTLHVTGMNMPTTGTVFKAALVKLDGSKVLGTILDSFSGGNLDFTFDGAVLPGKFYRVDLFIDQNKDGKCQASEPIFSKNSDSLGGTQTDGLTGRTLEMTIDGKTDVGVAAACSSFQ